MKKKVLSMVLAVALTMGLMCGCGAKTEEASAETTETPAATEEATDTVEGEKVTIRMSYWNSEDTVKAMLDYLATEVPNVEIEYQFIDNSNYDTIIDTQLSAGEGPDIICESPGSALKHARLGYLAPVDDLAAKYSAAGTSIYSYEGSTYALPGISWFEGIYGAAFELPEAYTSVSETLAAGNVYCPWNEWGVAASAHEIYGTEMQSYLLGTQDLATTLQNVDTAVAELLAK